MLELPPLSSKLSFLRLSDGDLFSLTFHSAPVSAACVEYENSILVE